ncbi:MaoC family dehydratase [Microbacterium testaceum]|uniref:Dehydratase n=1 Tax=Microbacterium testaceum TaxID=2033 RepID=A0A147F2V3_MICTE|nr:MaoC family dehydratase [Microbacterium testaceum]KTS06798.1 dehydratase [Microbacterium testaceum]
MSGIRIIQRGLYFDELEEGATYVHSPGRTVTEADNVLFTTLTMNTQSLHLDAAWSASTEFGERLVNSMFTLSTMVGLSVAQLTQGTIVANLGFSDVRFPAPVRVGDTLYAATLIAGKRLSTSRPGQGIVEFAHTMRNQNGVVVAEARRSTLMLVSPASASGPATAPGPDPVPDRNPEEEP